MQEKITESLLRLLRTNEAANYLSVSEHWLKASRFRPELAGPPFVKIGRVVKMAGLKVGRVAKTGREMSGVKTGRTGRVLKTRSGVALVRRAATRTQLQSGRALGGVTKAFGASGTRRIVRPSSGKQARHMTTTGSALQTSCGKRQARAIGMMAAATVWARWGSTAVAVPGGCLWIQLKTKAWVGAQRWWRLVVSFRSKAAARNPRLRLRVRRKPRQQVLQKPCQIWT